MTVVCFCYLSPVTIFHRAGPPPPVPPPRRPHHYGNVQGAPRPPSEQGSTESSRVQPPVPTQTPTEDRPDEAAQAEDIVPESKPPVSAKIAAGGGPRQEEPLYGTVPQSPLVRCFKHVTQNTHTMS
ncbi:hypothetical protein TGPRC2_203685 [Toxoplasma gondii TgCatPRC2]|uniref:Uncharacterized protein n=1 Tax=Toxoplasma gondii TgCatPRC2 TaxID=1130821 RepID=A0A151HAU2_TOXGO|nr:hypothetical protein TGPRC2_203685 [Toxoplasma gondii TgCatPRC2]